MNIEIADKWVAALRSGEYKQATGALYTGNGYCCLGVLCKVLGEEFINKYQSGPPCTTIRWMVNGEETILPRNVIDRAEMSSSYGCYDARRASLTKDNDGGKTFSEIADIIDKYKHEL